jgi:hypothetical protein
MEIGKACMATALIACEQTELIFRNPPDGGIHWMKYLLGRMQGQHFEDFADNTVTFVTFNYDRVLEHFLCTALQSSWGQSEEAAGAILRRILIIHLHGQLGFLPWQSDKNIRRFEPSIDAQSLRIAADGIKVVHEGVEDRKEQFDAAKAAIAGADHTYFLGVGTSNVNLERLDVANFKDAKASATEVGLTQTEHNEVVKRYGPKIEFRQDYDCKRMISDFVRWD